MSNYTHDELKNLDPVAYAKEINAERTAQAKAEGWTFWTLLPEDLEFYDENGYESAYDYERSSSFQELSDTFKEINGWRPRGIYSFEQMDLAAIENEILRLLNQEEGRKKAEQEEEARVAAKIAAATEGTPLTHNPFAALRGVC